MVGPLGKRRNIVPVETVEVDEVRLGIGVHTPSCNVGLDARFSVSVQVAPGTRSRVLIARLRGCLVDDRLGPDAATQIGEPSDESMS